MCAPHEIKKRERKKTNIKFHFLVTPLAQTQNHQTAYVLYRIQTRGANVVAQYLKSKKKKNDG